MSFEALISVSKKRSKPYNLALKVVNTTGQNFSFTCSNHSKPADFKYGFTEDNISLTPAVASSGADRTTYIIPILANAQKLYIHFPEPVVKAGSFLQMNTNSYVTEVLFWDKFPQERIAFFGWVTLSKVPTTTWDACRSFENMFNGCSSFNQLLTYDTSKIISMSGTFAGCGAYNKPLNWNTVNVINMSGMLQNCSNFNQVVNFDSRNVTNMRAMFNGCVKLNMPVTLNVVKVTNVEYLFSGCTIFNQNLSTTIFKTSTLKSYYDENCPAWTTANKPKFTA